MCRSNIIRARPSESRNDKEQQSEVNGSVKIEESLNEVNYFIISLLCNASLGY